jgi:acetyltransferase-like isoleucine patch superfamily enzyme
LNRFFAHETAIVEDQAVVGNDTKIWHQAQIRRGASVGARCIIGKGVFIDANVKIGDDSKLQNYACVYHGVELGRGVFVGPHVVFTNDMRPRAADPDFNVLADGDWEVGTTIVGDGCAVGANSTILPDVSIGKWAMIGAGAVVTRDVPAYGLVIGSPARFVGWVCSCGNRVDSGTCSRCGDLPADHPLARSTAKR